VLVGDPDSAVNKGWLFAENGHRGELERNHKKTFDNIRKICYYSQAV
jgi:hypothetical protein